MTFQKIIPRAAIIMIPIWAWAISCLTGCSNLTPAQNDALLRLGERALDRAIPVKVSK